MRICTRRTKDKVASRFLAAPTKVKESAGRSYRPWRATYLPNFSIRSMDSLEPSSPLKTAKPDEKVIILTRSQTRLELERASRIGKRSSCFPIGSHTKRRRLRRRRKRRNPWDSCAPPGKEDVRFHLSLGTKWSTIGRICRLRRYANETFMTLGTLFRLEIRHKMVFDFEPIGLIIKLFVEVGRPVHAMPRMPDG